MWVMTTYKTMKNDMSCINKKESPRIEFDLEYFNKITKGGLPNKTLNIALAGTGVGKSLFMCHMASVLFSFKEQECFVHHYGDG